MLGLMLIHVSKIYHRRCNDNKSKKTLRVVYFCGVYCNTDLTMMDVIAGPKEK